MVAEETLEHARRDWTVVSIGSDRSTVYRDVTRMRTSTAGNRSE
jgi:hypothetical protein